MKYGAAVEAVVAGTHPDPFSFLGPHRTDPEDPGPITIIRAFLPGARSVQVVSPAGEAGELELVHEAGLFAAEVAAPPEYRLRVSYPTAESVVEDVYRFPSTLEEREWRLLGEPEYRDYEVLGAHPMEFEGVWGVRFAVWAPNSRRVSVVGEFNLWDGRRHVMRNHPDAGVWEVFVPSMEPGAAYKYELLGPEGELLPLKADPYGFRAELRPGTSSLVHDDARYEWGDADWLQGRGQRNALDAPISVYELHLGSWKRSAGGGFPGYRELAEELVPYIVEMGFTHVELLPPTEHPFDGSWGYQPLGMFAPTSRFGSPDEFKHLVDALHRAGIGVVMDWVPAHFPEDPHGLAYFDGTRLYEHADPRRGRHMDWGTLVFNLGREEVRNYLLSNALFWLEEYHVDALRVDAVASMLYLDYSREEGQWVPNEHGGNEDLEAVAFLKRLNELVYGRQPQTATMAEESTSWPMVSRPTSLGGLGFGYKWNMGWMHDTLEYIQQDPIHRSYSHDKLTFGLVYAFDENFILPLSHDEVVHGKRSILGRMPGDEWQRFANLRLYYAFMYAHPGKKLLFMGDEFGQEREWNHDAGLDWHLLQNGYHRGVQRTLRDLNELYRSQPTLYQKDFVPEGFEWVEAEDRERSVLAFLRRDAEGEPVLAVCNFTPVVREGYRLGVPRGGNYTELLNTDAGEYGGSGVVNGEVASEAVAANGFADSVSLTLPPLGAVFLKRSAAG